jgi:glycosyltransferase involved in cell wall biosynthesis
LKIAQIMAGADRGGAELFFERLVVALHRAGADQLLVIRRNSDRAARLTSDAVAPVELPFGGLFDFVTPRRLEEELERANARVALAWMSRAAAKTPARHATVLCGRLGGYYDLKYYRHCRHLIGNTRAIADHIIESGWPADRAHYLPNFAPDTRGAVPHPRAAESTPEDVPLLLALGRYHRNKGFDVLIDALAEVPRTWLWIAGEGPERDALAHRAAMRGVSDRLRLLGWRQDTAALLAAADALVCPSRHEPLGNVVLEAFAQCRPVVAAAAQGPSALIRDGESGLLVPIEDAGALARAINRILADAHLRQDLAAAGRASYELHFTEAAVVKAYTQFFEMVAH